MNCVRSATFHQGRDVASSEAPHPPIPMSAMAHSGHTCTTCGLPVDCCRSNLSRYYYFLFSGSLDKRPLPSFAASSHFQIHLSSASWKVIVLMENLLSYSTLPSVT